jgi:tagatose-1,6-bisphosphate aldolase
MRAGVAKPRHRTELDAEQVALAVHGDHAGMIAGRAAWAECTQALAARGDEAAAALTCGPART